MLLSHQIQHQNIPQNQSNSYSPPLNYPFTNRKNNFIIHNRRYIKSIKTSPIEDLFHQISDKQTCDELSTSKNTKTYSNNTVKLQKGILKKQINSLPKIGGINKRMVSYQFVMKNESDVMQLIEKNRNEMKRLFQPFSLNERIDISSRIQKIAIECYLQDVIDLNWDQEQRKKQVYKIIIAQKMFIISILELCLNGRLRTNIKIIKDILKKIIQYYNLISHLFDSSSKKIHPKTPINIKSEHYKIKQSIIKLISRFQIHSYFKYVFALTQTNILTLWSQIRTYYAHHLSSLKINRISIKQLYWPLQTSPAPYLPYSSDYTLVLDLDQTLIHCNQFNQIFIRPFANQFLNILKYNYQIVIFTAGMKDYADFIIDQLQQKQAISHRLYRHHTTRVNSLKVIKDLQRLGRPLNKIVMIDNLKQNFEKQYFNGIQIKSWYGGKDCELQRISKYLIEIVQKQQDVREYIKRVFH